MSMSSSLEKKKIGLTGTQQRGGSLMGDSQRRLHYVLSLAVTGVVLGYVLHVTSQHECMGRPSQQLNGVVIVWWWSLSRRHRERERVSYT